MKAGSRLLNRLFWWRRLYLPPRRRAVAMPAEDYFRYKVGKRVPKNVTRVRIHHSVEQIPPSTFKDCTALVEVKLHEGLRRIGYDAFGSCSSLTRIIVPSSVRSIDNYAFQECNKLVEVVLHEGLRQIGHCAFRNCSSLLRINIPPSVRSIDNYAFEECNKLVEVELHYGLRTIGKNAFRNCSSLIHINIPPSVEAIYYSAALKLYFNIPSSVTSIGDNPFDGCVGLLWIWAKPYLEIDTIKHVLYYL